MTPTCHRSDHARRVGIMLFLLGCLAWPRVAWRRFMHRILVVVVVASVLSAPRSGVSAEFNAGAAVTDVTPISLPVKVNGSLAIRKVGRVKTPLSARAIVLDA